MTAFPEPHSQPERFWSLFDLTDLFASGLESYLQRLTVSCSEWFGASGASLFLRDGPETLSLACAAGVQTRIPTGSVISLGEGVAGRVLKRGKPRILNDLNNESDLTDIDSHSPSVSSSMVLPLIDPSGETVGVLNLSRSSDEEPFEPEHLEEAQVVAGQAALAISNAHLIEAKQRAERTASHFSRLADIGKVTAQIAHEIRNPLTGIHAAAQMIEDDPESSQMFAEIIREEAQRLNGLCDEFLAYAKPVRIVKEPGRASVPLTRASAIMKPAFDQKGVVFHCRPDAQDPMIRLDSDRMQQAVLNLLKNALEACEPGDQVTATCGAWGLEVKDTGIGMDTAAKEEALQPFTSSKPTGTGLGLSMVQKTVEAHGWSMQLTSDKGEGTSVKLFRQEN